MKTATHREIIGRLAPMGFHGGTGMVDTLRRAVRWAVAVVEPEPPFDKETCDRLNADVHYVTTGERDWVPDAIRVDYWRISGGDMVPGGIDVHVAEVGVHHPIDMAKLRRYGGWWLAADCTDALIHLHVWDVREQFVQCVYSSMAQNHLDVAYADIMTAVGRDVVCSPVLPAIRWDQFPSVLRSGRGAWERRYGCGVVQVPPQPGFSAPFKPAGEYRALAA